MKKLVLRPLIHRGRDCFGINFAYDKKIQQALQKTGLVKFSRTLGCWYAPLNRENFERLLQVLKGLAIPAICELSFSLTENKQEAPVKSRASCIKIIREEKPMACPAVGKRCINFLYLPGKFLILESILFFSSPSVKFPLTNSLIK